MVNNAARCAPNTMILLFHQDFESHRILSRLPIPVKLKLLMRRDKFEQEYTNSIKNFTWALDLLILTACSEQIHIPTGIGLGSPSISPYLWFLGSQSYLQLLSQSLLEQKINQFRYVQRYAQQKLQTPVVSKRLHGLFRGT